MDSYFAVTPVFVLKASSTFWKLSCSLAPQSDMTLIVLPEAPVPGAFPPDEQAVATSRATSETMAKGRENRSIAKPPLRTRRPGPPRILLTCASRRLAANAASTADRD